MNRAVAWAGRVVSTRTFKVLFVVIIAAVILAAIFGDPSEDSDSGSVAATGRPPDTVRMISTTTPTIVVSPTDTLLPPIEHKPLFPRSTNRNLSTRDTTRPGYCGHYAAWQQAERAADRAEAANDPYALADAMDRRSVAANRMWAAAPAGATWDSIRRECG